MRHLTRRLATAAAVAATLTGISLATAPAASAMPPGTAFQYGALSCKTLAYADGDGAVECNGLQGNTWRSLVECSWGFSYYGNWQNNYLGGKTTSRADSNCFFGVEDVTISSNG
ncbi:hypothetical protein SAMN05216553_108335 [Lentzea fradiae]|uniref:Beta/Gamma crystallin n=1 Tax=Lentzea fradiae TaxID=200378 RepID=A0A1G7UPC1_9PSEU|nr:hypothetical protein [Lentzea fradiae]SDG49445.1 hypothetical protein SAMN05216553_108335 [Lentzea fradiae]